MPVDQPEKPAVDQRELAADVLRAAVPFAEASMFAFADQNPAMALRAAAAAPHYGVKIAGVLTGAPAVTLFINVDGDERMVAHCDFKRIEVGNMN